VPRAIHTGRDSPNGFGADTSRFGQQYMHTSSTFRPGAIASIRIATMEFTVLVSHVRFIDEMLGRRPCRKSFARPRLGIFCNNPRPSSTCIAAGAQVWRTVQSRVPGCSWRATPLQRSSLPRYCEMDCRQGNNRNLFQLQPATKSDGTVRRICRTLKDRAKTCAKARVLAFHSSLPIMGYVA
jgi:hypothetical protein